MPRQPFLPKYEGTGYFIGARVLDTHPHIAVPIAKCITMWTWAESDMGCLFAQLLGTQSEATMEVFLNLRRASKQREALNLAAKYALSGEDKLVFDALMIIYKSLEAQRNDLAHGCFGETNAIPDGFLWIDSKNYVHFRAEILGQEKTKMFPPDRHGRLKKHLFVYKFTDLETLYEEMDAFRQAGTLLTAALRNSGSELGARQRELLYKTPLLQPEMSRLRAGRESNPKSPP